MSLIIMTILFFISATVVFPSNVVNLILFIIAVFLFIINLGRIDEHNGFGDNDDDDNTPPKQPQD